MSPLTLRYILLSILATATAMATPSPYLGLSLAPTFITVAQSFPNGSISTIAQTEATDSYQTILASLAAGKPLDSPQALNQALQQSLKLAQVETNTHFNARLHIPVVSLPTTFHLHSPLTPIIKDAMTSIGFGPSSDPASLPLQIIEMPLAAHYAYNLGTAKGLGLDDKTVVDWDTDAPEALVVDYTSHGLSLSLIDLAEHGCVTRASTHYPQLNEKSAGYADFFEPTISSFLDGELLRSDTAANTGAGWKPLFSDIRAVVLAGDASVEGFDGLRGVLREVLADLPGRKWLRDWIEPREMAAIGAAKRAMHLLDGDDEELHVHVQVVDHDHHDEL